ncbi:MAG: bifunctional oligoribonuclease/PAP phosphatase NrnA [Ruminococcaceae bacterium]|nr:bifunctional oligoribonuclease/PAP phosphatase NrnA [Oscillospiraceae bacterium]
MQHKVMEHLTSRSSVAIFVHVNPDWDCIGSAFALRNALRSAGIKSDIFTDEPLNRHLSILETDVVCYTPDAVAPAYQCYCAVDVGTPDRMGEWGRFFTQNPDTVCIDHHHLPQIVTAVNYIEPSRSATGELIYELIASSDICLTREIASYLYCAISSDTGSFQYASVNRRTYEILIALTDTGINTTYLCSMLYERNTLTQLQLKAEAINSIQLFSGGRIATAKLTNEVIEKYGATKSDADALAQLPRSIDGVMMSAFLKELPDGSIRVNLRSLGDYNIEPIARKFGGGGHRKAAGCTFNNITLEEAEKQLVQEMEKL